MQQAEYMSVPTAAELRAGRAEQVAMARRWRLVKAAIEVAIAAAVIVFLMWSVYGAWLMQGAAEAMWMHGVGW
jgi:hypothetical protein